MGFTWRCALPAFLLGAVLALPAGAQDYPARPIRVVVAFAAGGSTDAVARILGEQLGKTLGGSVVIDNKPGGAATIGMSQVAQAAADGYTLGAANISFGANPGIMRKVPFDAEKDFTPVSLVAHVPLVLAVHPSVSARSVKELIAMAKEKPETLSYASAGYASGSHLSMALFSSMTDVKLIHVPYNGGGPQVGGALGGQITCLFATIPAAQQYFETGKLVPLAVTSAKRDPRLPNVPTVAEAGVPGFVMGDWVGIVAPAGTPAAIVERLNKAIVDSLAVPETRARIENVGTQVVGSTAAELAEHVRAEIAKWRRVGESAGIHIE